MTEQPKTVRVRIACVVNADGKWSAHGYCPPTGKHPVIHERAISDVAHEMMAEWPLNHDTLHFIEADVPIPQIPTPQVIEGKVVE